MPVRSRACTLLFMICMPMFNRKLCTVIKSILFANVHHGKLKFNEADYVMAWIRPKIFLKRSFKRLFGRACGLYGVREVFATMHIKLMFCRCTFAYLSHFSKTPRIWDFTDVLLHTSHFFRKCDRWFRDFFTFNSKAASCSAISG